MSDYTTRCTWLGNQYGCQVFYQGQLVVEGRCPTRDLIGPTFRDLMRTMDKLGGDAFTHAARYRNWKDGNVRHPVKHIWSR